MSELAALPAGWISDGGIPKVPVAWDPRTGRLIYSLQPKQYEALLATPLLRWDRTGVYQGARWIGYGGSAGGGKSHLARVVAFLVAHLWPGSTSIIFRRTEGEVIENHLMQFYKEVPRELWKWNGKERAITWWNGSRTLLGYLKKDEDVFTYQGNAYDCMVFEESTHYSWFQVNWLTANRLRASIAGTVPFALFPSNPGNKGHFWFKRLFIDREYEADFDEHAENFHFLQARLSDNYELNRRDPEYVRKLNTLEEPWRSWLRDGDWHAGAGGALPMLRKDKHLVTPFAPPKYWFSFGAFDWGFSHPFVFGYYSVNEDGRIYKVDTIRGRNLSPREIGERIRDTADARGLDLGRLRYVVGGPDAFGDKAKSLGVVAPTIAEQVKQSAKVNMIEGNPARILGLNNLRDQLRWELPDPQDATGARKIEGEPNLVFMDTPGNAFTWKCLTSRVLDEDNPEDVQKTNADSFGRGGDDEYDETKLAVNSRPRRAVATFCDKQVDAWAPDTLAHEADQQRRSKPGRKKGPAPRGVVLPEGGLA